VYSNGSGIGGEVGMAAVLFRNGEEWRVLGKYLGKEEHHTVFKAEVMGLTLTAEGSGHRGTWIQQK